MIMEKQKEIMPLYSMVMIEPYDENPYEIKTTESGLKLTNDKFESPDTGNIEKTDFFIGAAKVIEAGPKCLYVKAGDDILYDKRSIRPIRFLGNIYFNLAEQNIVAVIAEGLKDRFNSIRE